MGGMAIPLMCTTVDGGYNQEVAFANYGIAKELV